MDNINLTTPCGIFCPACPRFNKHNTCRGCRLDSIHDSCEIYECCTKIGGKNFCFECDLFPCERLKHFAEYFPGQSFAHYRHISIENLKLIKEIGVDKWVELMLKKVVSGEYKILQKDEEGNLDRSPCACVQSKLKEI